MNVTFRQLRLFLALADTGSVSGAARATHVTQPTASMQLREVTQAVGLPLYEMVGKKIHLTQVGLDLASTARTLFQCWDSFEQHVDGLKGLSRGKLRIAAVSTAKYFVPRLVGRFCQQYPAIDVSLEILNRDGVVQRLRDHLSAEDALPADLRAAAAVEIALELFEIENFQEIGDGGAHRWSITCRAGVCRMVHGEAGASRRGGWHSPPTRRMTGGRRGQRSDRDDPDRTDRFRRGDRRLRRGRAVRGRGGARAGCERVRARALDAEDLVRSFANADGAVSVSPSSTCTCDIGMPSSSATICAYVVS